MRSLKSYFKHKTYGEGFKITKEAVMGVTDQLQELRDKYEEYVKTAGLQGGIYSTTTANTMTGLAQAQAGGQSGTSLTPGAWQQYQQYNPPPPMPTMQQWISPEQKCLDEIIKFLEKFGLELEALKDRVGKSEKMVQGIALNIPDIITETLDKYFKEGVAGMTILNKETGDNLTVKNNVFAGLKPGTMVKVDSLGNTML